MYFLRAFTQPKGAFDGQVFLHSCVLSIPKTRLKPQDTKRQPGKNIAGREKPTDDNRGTPGHCSLECRMSQGGDTILSLFCDGAGGQGFCDRFHNGGLIPYSKGDRALTTMVRDCNNLCKYLSSFSVKEWIIASLQTSGVATWLALAKEMRAEMMCQFPAESLIHHFFLLYCETGNRPCRGFLASLGPEWAHVEWRDAYSWAKNTELLSLPQRPLASPCSTVQSTHGNKASRPEHNVLVLFSNA